MEILLKTTLFCCLVAIFNVGTVLKAEEPNISHLAWASGITATGCLTAGSAACLKEGIKNLYQCKNSDNQNCFEESMQVCVDEGTQSCLDLSGRLLFLYLMLYSTTPLDKHLEKFKMAWSKILFE